MKVAALCLSLIAGAAAFSQPEVSRREAGAAIAAAGAAFLPAAASASIGESPRFSIFGVIGDGSSYSEGAAYGSDQSTKVYSPYSVYGDGTGAVYDEANPEYAARKKAVLAETAKRLSNLDKYIERKEWFNVTTELDRYMYETRGAVKGLAKSPAQQAKATDFFKAIEKTDLSARLRKQDACSAAAKDAQAALDAFVASV